MEVAEVVHEVVVAVVSAVEMTEEAVVFVVETTEEAVAAVVSEAEAAAVVVDFEVAEDVDTNPAKKNSFPFCLLLAIFCVASLIIVVFFYSLYYTKQTT